MSVALIETVRVRDAVAPLWGLHLRRLLRSCRELGVPFPGELTVGNLRYGVVLLHRTRSFALGSALRQ